MCNFWSAIVSRTGKVYHLGEIVVHESIIEKFKLKDGDTQHICRVEIPVLNSDFGFKPEKEWVLKVDERETPGWWSVAKEDACLKEFKSWLKKSKFRAQLKAFLNGAYLNELKNKTGEQIIHRTKLLLGHEKLVVQYYLLGEKKSWGSVWDSVWVSVWGSVRDSLWDSVWDSVWVSVRDSVRDSLWDSVWDSVWKQLFSNKPYPLALPKKIFDLGYIHCLVKEKDDVTRIHVYGKRGILLKKIDFKDKKGKILVQEKVKEMGK